MVLPAKAPRRNATSVNPTHSLWRQLHYTHAGAPPTLHIAAVGEGCRGAAVGEILHPCARGCFLLPKETSRGIPYSKKLGVAVPCIPPRITDWKARFARGIHEVQHGLPPSQEATVAIPGSSNFELSLQFF